MKNLKKNLDEMYYFKIDDSEEDIKNRAQYYRSMFTVFFCLGYFFIMLLSPMRNQLDDSLREFIFNVFIFLIFSAGFLWAAIFLVVRFYSKVLTVILVILSTLISYIYLDAVPYIVQDGYVLFKWGWFENINFSTIIIYLTILFSILFQLIIIWIRPVYKLTVTKLTFMYINVFFTTSTLLLFIFLDDIALKIHENYPMIDLEDISKELNQFFRIATFPYIAGAVFCTLYIEQKTNRAKAKAEKLLFSIMEQINRKDMTILSMVEKRKLQQSVKQCIFNGGEIYKIPLLCSRDIQKLFEGDISSKNK